MLNTYRPFLTKVHKPDVVNFINDMGSILFFFKFIKLKKKIKENLSITNNLALLLNIRRLKLRRWERFLLKRKKYKPYSIFKFNMLKYRRTFNPQKVYKLALYTLTRYNHLMLCSSILELQNQSKRIVSLSKYRYFNDLTSFFKKIKTNYSVKYNKTKFKKINKFKNSAIAGYVGMSRYSIQASEEGFFRFILWVKYKRFGWFKKFKKKYKIINRIPKLNSSTLTQVILRTNKRRFVVKNKNTKLMNVNLTKLTTATEKVKSQTTLFSYAIRDSRTTAKLKILTLKVLFNSYNYKTYNWRIVN